ncbi:MAG: VOC family protein [Geminicoccaceae bacterium]
MTIKPYLFFDGCAEEAIAFYREVLGAEVLMLMRFKECPDPPPPGVGAPGSENKVMHASLKIGDAELMLSDGSCGGQPEFRGMSLALSAKDAGEARRLFSALGEGGQVQMPFGPTFFSPGFGIVADRFGVSWMVVTES